MVFVNIVINFMKPLLTVLTVLSLVLLICEPLINNKQLSVSVDEEVANNTEVLSSKIIKLDDYRKERGVI